MNRHPPDERLFGASLTPGGGHWQAEPRRDRPVPEAGRHRHLRAGNSNWSSPTNLSRGFAGTHAAGLFTLAQDQAAAAVRRSVAGSRRTLLVTATSPRAIYIKLLIIIAESRQNRSELRCHPANAGLNVPIIGGVGIGYLCPLKNALVIPGFIYTTPSNDAGDFEMGMQ